MFISNQCHLSIALKCQTTNILFLSLWFHVFVLGTHLTAVQSVVVHKLTVCCVCKLYKSRWY